MSHGIACCCLFRGHPPYTLQLGTLYVKKAQKLPSKHEYRSKWAKMVENETRNMFAQHFYAIWPISDEFWKNPFFWFFWPHEPHIHIHTYPCGKCNYSPNLLLNSMREAQRGQKLSLLVSRYVFPCLWVNPNPFDCLARSHHMVLNIFSKIGEKWG